MKNKNTDMDSELSRWLNQHFKKVDYSSVLVEAHRKDSKTFSPTLKEDAEETDLKLIVRAECLRNNHVYFCSSTIEDSDIGGLKFGLMSAKRNFIETDIYVPSSRNIKTPEETVVNNEIQQTWEIDSDLISDMENAAKVKTRMIIPKTNYNIESSVYYFKDSNGIYVEYGLANFLVESRIILNDKRSIHRRIGFVPRKDSDLKKIYRLFPFIQDITPDQRLKDSKTIEDLTRNLIGITKDVHKNQKIINPGRYNIVTPMTTFPHECVAHIFEDDLLKTRTDLGDPKVVEDNYFHNGDKVAPDTLTVKDNPKTTLRRLPLIGTRNYDMEGFPTYKKTHINKGKVMNQRLGSKYSRNKNVGNAISSESLMPQPRATVTETLLDENGISSIKDFIDASSGRTLFCIRNSASVNTYDGSFVLGESDEYGYDVEIYYVENNGNFSPVKMPQIMSGVVGLSLEDIQLGGRWSYSYDVGKCGKGNPSTQLEYDSIYSSQVGPLALIPNIYVRTLRNVGEMKF